ncbi:MAG: 2-oxoglutarate dehydrogenase [Aromatoleum sp.]|nr:2-oxoglutarate dehydrogenase [Aromatoleum sp.]
MSSDAPQLTVKLFFREAIARALCEEMSRDDSVIVLGQDVGRFGGSYREFAGLYERFGAARVRDTPVAEASMIGLGVGAAAAGMRPLVSITYMDFLMLGLDPLVNYAAKARFKTGGQLRAPVVVKTTAGAKGQGVAHSQCIEAWLMGVPGLKVVAPSTPGDAYGLLKSALHEAGPVVFVDHKRLFPTAGEVPLGEATVPIGKAVVRRQGTDVTIVTHSWMTTVAADAAARLVPEGISCEIVDLRTLAPLDTPTLCASVAKTGALLTLEEGQTTCGVGAEVAFRVREALGTSRVARVGARAAPVSSNPVLEAACLPGAQTVIDAVVRLLTS